MRNDRERYRRRKRHCCCLNFMIAVILVSAAVMILLNRGNPFSEIFPVSGSSSDRYSQQSETGGDVSQKTTQALEAMARQYPAMEPVLQNPGQYPERLLESLSRNPELLDFTLDYPEKKGTSSDRIDLSNRYQQGEIPLLMQWDEDWGYASYGDGIIALDGCGPTCLSMVAIGLTGDTSITPKAVASFSEKNGYLDTKTNSTLWTLMSEGAKRFGLDSRELPLEESLMSRELSQGHPIICCLGPGDFTTQGHFIVLSGCQDGEFSIKDPNSKARSEKTWSYDTLKSQIRNLWALSA